jgi:NADPH-ferrihemoprotein reductase
VKFWEAAKAKFGGSEESGPAKFEPTTVLNWVESKENAPPAEETKSEEDDFVIVDSPRVPAVFIDPKHKGGSALVTDNYELRQDPGSDSTKHIEIDISDLPFAYRTADNLGVLPRNDYKLVAKVARRLGLSLKSKFTLSAKNGGRKLPIPSPCTVHDALLWYCDLTSVPKRTLLETFMQYATEAADKAKLSQFVHDGKAAYLEDKKNLLDVLDEVPSVKIPFGDFLEMCPRLVPRYYTISSSARHRPDRLTITVVVTHGDKPRGRVHNGVCSTYLSQLVPNKDRVAVFCRDSTFRPTWEIQGPATKNPPAPPAGVRPDAPPMILVGPGTGVAPFRGFLQEAALLAKAGVKVPELMLFFGCQRQNKDFLYKNELTQHHEQGLVKLFTAFSRETSQKVYVQHKMLEQGAAIWDLVNNKGGSIFICGATAMGTDVRSVLVEIFQKFGGKTEAQATDLFRALQTQKRLVQELWD